MELNLTDLTKLLAACAAAFAFLRVVIGKPILRQIINPHRMPCLLTALGFFGVTMGVLREQTHSGNPLAWLVPLRNLITEEKSTGAIMIAGFSLLNGIALLALVIFCYLRLPRDPATFRHRKDLGRLVQYYTRLTGGLDFAVLMRLNKAPQAKPEVVALGVNRKELQERLDHLVPFRTAEQQIEWWKDLALEIHYEMDRLNTALAKAGQGHNRRVLLDVQYGGFLFQYVRAPEIGHDIQFVLAATLLQQEVDNRLFEDHFDLLMRAIRSVEASREKL